MGGLAATTLVGTLLQDTVTEKAYCTSVKATWTLLGMTGGEDDGPLLCGWAHSDYSDAEIEAFIELATSWDTGDKISQEINRRLIRIVGTFGGPDGVGDANALNDGKPINTKLGWMINSGQTLKMWVFNLGTSALDTTTPKVFVNGHANLWPQ